MNKKVKISEKQLGCIIENNENDILMYPHSYLKFKKKSITPSIIVAIVLFVLTFIGIQVVYNILFPSNLVMKIGNIKVTEQDYQKIYESDILPVKEEILESQGNTDIDVEEKIEDSDKFSRENLYYIQEKILLGLKAEELGYVVKEDTYNEKQQIYGNLYKYFALANSLESNIMNKSTYLTLAERKEVYNGLKEDLINYSESTVTYQKYYTDSTFQRLDNNKLETITQSYSDFCTDNYVLNVPTADAYYSVANNMYIYYKIISNNIVYFSYSESTDYVDNAYSKIMTEGMRDAFIAEMAQKYKIKVYI